MRRAALAGFAVACGLLAGPSPASAHPLAPSALRLEERADGTTLVRFTQPAARVRGSELRPVLPAGCPARGTPQVETTDTQVVRSWSVHCEPAGWRGRRIAVEGLPGSRTDVVVTLDLADGGRETAVLRASEPAFEVPARAEAGAVIGTYTRLGVEHILTGVDHLLFVLGLLILLAGLAELAKTITAFTLGHSVTLAAAALGVVAPPQGPIEVLIALSVFALAVELARRQAGEGSGLWQRPWRMAALFGLLHGLGFAGALREIGLPQGQVPAALLSFNVGVELGQLAFVAVAWPLWRAVRHTSPVWRWAPIYGMGSLAGFWLFGRTASALLGG